MSLKTLKVFFLVAAIYDFGLGILFFLFYRPIYQKLGLILPEHPGYLQLAALYIAIFGVGFWLVSQNPVQNRAIVPLGILMKIAFASIAFWHFLTDIMPKVYLVFAACDVGFLALFVVAYATLNRMAAQASPASDAPS